MVHPDKPDKDKYSFLLQQWRDIEHMLVERGSARYSFFKILLRCIARELIQVGSDSPSTGKIQSYGCSWWPCWAHLASRVLNESS
jgi:hypothetical protein